MNKKRTALAILVGFLSISLVTLAGWSLATGTFPNLSPAPSPTTAEEWNLSDVPTAWLEITPGLELRQVSIQEIPALLLRVNLDVLSLDLIYDPTNPQKVADWRTSTGALMVVNAGFFEADYTTSGIMVIEDEVYGRSYTQRRNASNLVSGMFVFDGNQAAIHPLDGNPMPISDTMQLGLESFPVLFHDSMPIDFRLPDRTARRTSLAVDGQGRLVFIVLYEEGITLYELRDDLFALSEELGLVSALNLDGGLSTGVSVLAGGIFLEMDSSSEVSSVFTLSP